MVVLGTTENCIATVPYFIRKLEPHGSSGIIFENQIEGEIYRNTHQLTERPI